MLGGALPVSIANSLLILSLALVMAEVRGAQAPASDTPPATYPFTFDTLLEDAKRLAAVPYAPQRNRLPTGLDKLSPEQYRSIRFNPEAGIWREANLPFRLELLRAGYNLQTAVTVSTVENGTAQDAVSSPAMFQLVAAMLRGSLCSRRRTRRPPSCLGDLTDYSIQTSGRP